MECENLKSPELRFPLQLQKRADFTLRLTFLHRSGVARGEKQFYLEAVGVRQRNKPNTVVHS